MFWEAGNQCSPPNSDWRLITSAPQTLGVIPAKAGIHFSARVGGEMDPRFRGDDAGVWDKTGSQQVTGGIR